MARTTRFFLRTNQRASVGNRLRGIETMEPRCLLSADPIDVGIVYLEQDAGADSHGDLFQLTFQGGAENTELRRVLIDGDQELNGFTIGDSFFDISQDGLGADSHAEFQLGTDAGIDHVRAIVADGGTQLVLEFEGFHAGESLVFEIDVDEVEDFDAVETDVDFINGGFDPITSGVEFQGTHFTAEFVAPHFFDVSDTSVFRNRYDSLLEQTSLPLPQDDDNGQRDRSAAAFLIEVEQQPIPASIEGRVQLSNENGDCFGREEDHIGIAGATVHLLNAEGDIIAETLTDENGDYAFTDLLPGTYSVRETTPDGLFDGGAQSGRFGSERRGQVNLHGDVTDIIVRGGDDIVDVSFCEHVGADLTGHVFHDRNNNGIRETGEEGIHQVVVRLMDSQGNMVEETKTDANGFYQFTNLRAGEYELVETQPAGFLDGLDSAGQVAGQTQGVAINPGDRINGITLGWHQQAVNYDFAEYQASSIRGRVQHSTRDGDCFGDDEDHEPVVGVSIQLLDPAGIVIAETLTDSNGIYEFLGLAPGEYGIREITPEQFLKGGAQAGVGQGKSLGQVQDAETIRGINIQSGTEAEHFDFCVHVPAMISGTVYHDANDNGQRNDEEQPIAGVVVELRDADDKIVATTTTDSRGAYKFGGLVAGQYSIHEIQPDGFLDGRDSAGTLDGSTRVGIVDSSSDTIRGIQLGWGDMGREFNFGELRTGTLTGRVHADVIVDCIYDADDGEQLLQGVTIQLLDVEGKVVAETQTDQNGEYAFNDLAPGEYRVRQIQPSEFFDGNVSIGNRGGVSNVANEILLRVGSGEELSDYDFCEITPSEISGRVHADIILDCEYDETQGEQLLAGVTIQLFADDGNLIAETQTDGNGTYTFRDLLPGNYRIRQIQPEAFFDGDVVIGSHGGQVQVANEFLVALDAGQEFANYNFCETTPSSLSGFVFQDGEPVELMEGESLPERVRDVRDGQRTQDDRFLPGVVLELRDGTSGLPVAATDAALPGTYADGVISTTTDANGFYAFEHLRPGTYAVFQPSQPIGLIDGVDTPGTTSGLVFNPGEQQQSVFTLADGVETNNDAIVRISLPPGTQSLENNFSEVAVNFIPQETPIVPIIPNLPRTPLPPGRNIPLSGPAPFAGDTPGRGGYQTQPTGGGSQLAKARTWHLSIINGGQPRGEGVTVQEVTSAWFVSAKANPSKITTDLAQAKWIMPVEYGDNATDSIAFGMPDGIPFSGDFNGDGLDEIGVFIDGEWFIDLNGNGVFDQGDLWARLGKRLDLPVTGDWDGDGKVDIGIFGREWFGDEFTIQNEPGLPDAENHTDDAKKNIPPQDKDSDGEPIALKRKRLLQHRHGGRVRADVVDHVFRFGHKDDLPVTGDWNGDGITTIGVFRKGTWHLDVDGNGRWSEFDRKIEFGNQGDIPLVGDFDGDGQVDLAVYRAGELIIDSNGNGKIDSNDERKTIGQPGDVPVVGDFNGDGVDEVAFYHTSSDARPVIYQAKRAG